MKPIAAFVFILLALALFNSDLFGQVDTSWVRKYTDVGRQFGAAKDLSIDRFGAIFVTGLSGYSNNYGYTTIKYATDGQQVWAKRYHFSSGNMALAITLDELGNSFVTGTSNRVGGYTDMATIKYGPSGDTLWVRRYSGAGDFPDFGYGVAVDKGGNVFVAGESIRNNFNSQDMVLLKYSTSGVQEWARVTPAQTGRVAFMENVAVDDLGFIYAAGTTERSGTSYDGVLFKYDSFGNLIWSQYYNGPQGASGDYFNTMALDGSGNILVTGESYTGTSTGWDIATIKYSPSGNRIWVKRYSGVGNYSDVSKSVCIDKNGGVYVVGKTATATNATDIVVIKYDSLGTEQWARTYDGPAHLADNGVGICVDSRGSVVVAGNSPGVGTGIDIAVIKFDSLGTQRWLTRYDGSYHGYDSIFAIGVDWEDNVILAGTSQDSVGRASFVTIKFTDKPLRFALKQATNPLTPFPPGKSITVIKVSALYQEDTLATLITDANGEIVPDTTWFQPGEQVKLSLVAGTDNATKPGHEAVDNVMYYTVLDNGVTGQTGVISYPLYQEFGSQQMVMGHTELRFNLVVSLEWDADRQFIDDAIRGLRMVSNYLYDVTDAQLCLNKIAVYDNKDHWENADIQVNASNYFLPSTQGTRDHNCGHVPITLPAGAAVYFPRSYTAGNTHNLDYLRNTTYSNYPGWTDPNVTFNGQTFHNSTVRALGHELGHDLMGLLDEYKGGNSSFNNQVSNYDFGLMDFLLDKDIPINSEMSSLIQYNQNPLYQSTSQWVGTGDRSCWDFFECTFQYTLNSVFLPIIRPDERAPYNQLITGPNDNLSLPDACCNKGALLDTVVVDHSTGAQILDLETVYPLGLTAPASDVSLFGSDGAFKFAQGRSSDDGRILCLGVHCNDVLRLSKEIEWFPDHFITWAYGTYTVCQTPSTSLSAPTVALDTVIGSFPFLPHCEITSRDAIRFRLFSHDAFDASPMAYDCPVDSAQQAISLNWNSGAYEGIGNLHNDGTFLVEMLDDSLNTFFFTSRYMLWDSAFTRGSASLYSADGTAEIAIDSANDGVHRVLMMTSSYPPPFDGIQFPSGVIGSVVDVADYPANSLSGGAELRVNYPQSEADIAREWNLGMFHWDQLAREWRSTTGSIDTVANTADFQLDESGAYAVIATRCCAGGRGNIDLKGIVDLSDLSGLVSYLTGGGYVLPCYDAANVNGTGIVDLSDLSALVSYVKGGGYVLPNCP